MDHILIATYLIILTFAFAALEGQIDMLKDKSIYISRQYQDIIKRMTDISIDLVHTRKELEKMKGEKNEL